ncbi:TraR/DksA C4-type zinc finger protein [Streptomyces sp. NPDC005065]|uniref:TraR/DksA C4-type zinc finger protein n=1 Tax=Streptomyces sp. NPDC005065 TaxID=3154461 RepID=UPI00339E5E41
MHRQLRRYPRCGEAIDPERLQAFPHLEYCLRCEAGGSAGPRRRWASQLAFVAPYPLRMPAACGRKALGRCHAGAGL